MFEQASVAGFIVGSCVLFVTFWVLFKREVESISPRVQCISLLILALTIFIALVSIVHTYITVKENVNLKAELTEANEDMFALSEKIQVYLTLQPSGI